MPAKKKKEAVKELTPAEKCQEKLQADLDVYMTLNNACYYGVLKSVEKFLATGKAQVDAVEEESGNTPLILAARNGHLKVIQALLKHGADITKKGFGGMSALHHACRGDHLSVTEFLVGPDCKAPLDAEDDAGNTAVNEASRMGNLKCMEAVINAGGKADHPNKAGVTPFMAAVMNCRGAIVDILAKQGVDVNKVDGNGNSSLHLAAMCGFPKVVRQLLVQNCDTSLVNTDGKKAEDVAATDAIKTSISAYE